MNMIKNSTYTQVFKLLTNSVELENIHYKFGAVVYEVCLLLQDLEIKATLEIPVDKTKQLTYKFRGCDLKFPKNKYLKRVSKKYRLHLKNIFCILHDELKKLPNDTPVRTLQCLNNSNDFSTASANMPVPKPVQSTRNDGCSLDQHPSQISSTNAGLREGSYTGCSDSQNPTTAPKNLLLTNCQPALKVRTCTTNTVESARQQNNVAKLTELCLVIDGVIQLIESSDNTPNNTIGLSLREVFTVLNNTLLDLHIFEDSETTTTKTLQEKLLFADARTSYRGYDAKVTSLLILYNQFNQKYLNKAHLEIKQYYLQKSKVYRLFERVSQFIAAKGYSPYGYILAQFHASSYTKVPSYVTFRSKKAESNYILLLYDLSRGNASRAVSSRIKREDPNWKSRLKLGGISG